MVFNLFILIKNIFVMCILAITQTLGMAEEARQVAELLTYNSFFY